MFRILFLKQFDPQSVIWFKLDIIWSVHFTDIMYCMFLAVIGTNVNNTWIQLQYIMRILKVIWLKHAEIYSHRKRYRAFLWQKLIIQYSIYIDMLQKYPLFSSRTILILTYEIFCTTHESVRLPYFFTYRLHDAYAMKLMYTYFLLRSKQLKSLSSIYWRFWSPSHARHFVLDTNTASHFTEAFVTSPGGTGLNLTPTRY